jgi:hypothetical protein
MLLLLLFSVNVRGGMGGRKAGREKERGARAPNRARTIRCSTTGARHHARCPSLQPWQTPPLAHSCDCLRCRGDLAARGVCVGRSQQATAIGWKESVAGDSGPREDGNSKATQKASTPFPVGGRCSMAALVEAPQARLRYLRQWGHGDRGPRRVGLHWFTQDGVGVRWLSLDDMGVGRRRVMMFGLLCAFRCRWAGGAVLRAVVSPTPHCTVPPCRASVLAVNLH